MNFSGDTPFSLAMARADKDLKNLHCWSLETLAGILPPGEHDFASLLDLCRGRRPTQHLRIKRGRRFNPLPGVFVECSYGDGGDYTDDSDSDESGYWCGYEARRKADKKTNIFYLPEGHTVIQEPEAPRKFTLLAVAVAFCDFRAVRAALDNGADPNQKGCWKHSFVVESLHHESNALQTDPKIPLQIFTELVRKGAAVGLEELVEASKDWFIRDEIVKKAVLSVFSPTQIVEYAIDAPLPHYEVGGALPHAVADKSVPVELVEELMAWHDFCRHSPVSHALLKVIRPPLSALKGFVSDVLTIDGVDVFRALPLCDGVLEDVRRAFSVREVTDPYLLQGLLALGADLLREDEEGGPLHGGWSRSPGVVDVLVHAGVDPNRPNPKGLTPLVAAAAHCPPEKVGAWCLSLLRAGATIPETPSPVRLVCLRWDREAPHASSTLLSAALILVDAGGAVPSDLVEYLLYHLWKGTYGIVPEWNYRDPLYRVVGDLAVRRPGDIADEAVLSLLPFAHLHSLVVDRGFMADSPRFPAHLQLHVFNQRAELVRRIRKSPTSRTFLPRPVVDVVLEFLLPRPRSPARRDSFSLEEPEEFCRAT